MATAGSGRATCESGGSGEELCTCPFLSDINEEPLNVSEEEAGRNVVEEQIDNKRIKFPKISMPSPKNPATIEDLPNELLSNIFIRLFAKQLAQMRTVTKPWNALLSQSYFVKSHLNHSIHNNNQILLVFYHKVCMSDPKPFTAHLSRSPHIQLTEFNKLPPVNPISKRTNSIRIVGAVNGLICSSYGHSIIHIWNPSLSAVSTLPKYPMPTHRSYQINLRFGFDPKTNDYKVIKIMGKTDSGSYRKEWLQTGVYSMRKGYWKLIDARLPSHIEWIFDGDYVCLDGHDGLLHWLCYCTSETKHTQTIVSFDLSSHTFCEIPLPLSVAGSSWDSFFLGVFARKLCVMSKKLTAADKCEVWVMEEYGVAESWVKQPIFSQFFGHRESFGFTSHAEFLFKDDNDRLVLYDSIANEAKIFEDFCDRKRHHPQKFMEYVDSLVWVAPGAGQN